MLEKETDTLFTLLPRIHVFLISSLSGTSWGAGAGLTVYPHHPGHCCGVMGKDFFFEGK